MQPHVGLIVEEHEVGQRKVLQLLVHGMSRIFKLAAQLQKRCGRLNVGDDNLSTPFKLILRLPSIYARKNLATKKKPRAGPRTCLCAQCRTCD